MSWNNITPAWMLAPEEKDMSGVNDANEIELERLRKDAKRWRFARQFGDPDFLLGEDFPIKEEPTSPAHMDALIDAAMIKYRFEE